MTTSQPSPASRKAATAAVLRDGGARRLPKPKRPPSALRLLTEFVAEIKTDRYGRIVLVPKEKGQGLQLEAMLKAALAPPERREGGTLMEQQVTQSLLAGHTGAKMNNPD